MKPVAPAPRIQSYDLANARPTIPLTPQQMAQLELLLRVHAQGDAEMRVALVGDRVVAHVLVILRMTPLARDLVTAWNNDHAALSERLERTQSALLTDLLVMEGHRRQGLGQSMVTDAIARARVAGAHRLTLHVSPENAGAIRIYHRAGFVSSGMTETGLSEYSLALTEIQP